MHLLQSGVDITVIALWLGHEDTATTHMYVQADLAMKEQALMKLQPGTAAPGRFRASDNLMSFLKTLRGLIPYRSEEHTSELQSLMRISYAVFCLKKKK